MANLQSLDQVLSSKVLGLFQTRSTGGMSISAHAVAIHIMHTSLHNFNDVHRHQNRGRKTTDMPSVPQTASAKLRAVIVASPCAMTAVI